MSTPGLRRIPCICRGSTAGRHLGGVLTRRIRQGELEDVIDDSMQFDPREINGRARVPNPPAATENRRSGDLASTRKLQSSFESEIPTFFDRDGFIANSERRVCGLETIPVDLIRLIKDYLLEGRNLEALQATNG